MEHSDVGVFKKMAGSGIFGSRRPQSEQPIGQRRVLFVSHEATRTGAPKIILNILAHFHEKCDIQCETILHNGGHLAGEFGEYSNVSCLNLARKSCDVLKKKIRRIVHREKNNRPLLAICNSMESRFISRELAELGIPILSLVHELPSSYTEEDYRQLYADSARIVFPVHAVKDATDGKLPLPDGKALVLPQGLLNPEFGKSISRDAAVAKIRTELGLPADSFIVLGCGTLDLRKGIDHYCAIARRVCVSPWQDRPVHFVWVGEGPRWTHSPYHYVQLDMDKSNVRGRVHFIGERADVEPYFVGSDAFLMSSRVDPFPCVIHEAMATGLPVITFENSGGAAEAVSNGAGFVVPYADYEQAANVIRLLASQPEVAEGIRDRSRERVETRYQFGDYADRLIELSETLTRQSLRREAPMTLPLTVPLGWRAAA